MPEHNEENIDILSEKMTGIACHDVMSVQRLTWTDAHEEHFYSSYVERYKNDKEAFETDWEKLEMEAKDART